MDRIIGRKDILAIIESMYGITTWMGALKFIKKRGLPMRRTPSGRPMFIKAELIKYDQRFESLISLP